MKYFITIVTIYGIMASGVPALAQSSPVGYSIKGHLAGLHEKTMLYLTRMRDKKLDTISTTQSTGEFFYFSGDIKEGEEGESYFIFVDTLDAAYKHLKRRYILLHLENSAIAIDGSIERLGPYDIDVKGSGVHEDLMEFSLEFKRRFVDKSEQLELLDTRSKLILSKDSSEQTLSRIEELRIAYEAATRKGPEFKAAWAQSHPTSLISPWLLLQVSDSLQTIVYPKLDKRAMSSFYGQQLKKELLRDEKLSIGKRAPDLSLPMPNGQLLSLHSVAEKHKLTIVDFWAYWCGPCRKSFPKLKELYNKYRAKGLAIYSVSIDSNKKRWLMALEEESLPWNNVIVEKNENLAKKVYGVSAIPACFLLDQKGNILHKWLGGESEQLEQFLLRL